MSLTVGVDSYISLEEAEEIVLNELFPTSKEYTTWVDLREMDKEVILRKGTRALEQFNYLGTRKPLATLKFPRAFDYKNDYIIPYEIKVGVVLQGIKLLLENSDKRATLIKAGVTSYKIGDISETYKNTRTGDISDEVLVYINKYICRYVR